MMEEKVMSIRKPDPLEAGHIDGQHPDTPERMPGHTSNVEGGRGKGIDNEEELGGRPAFLFEAGEQKGVTLDSSGANLPQPSDGSVWRLVRYFTLGVRDVGPLGVNPETVVRGIFSDGFYVWRPSDPSRMQSTSQ
jgi:hypothetical protein